MLELARQSGFRAGALGTMFPYPATPELSMALASLVLRKECRSGRNQLRGLNRVSGSSESMETGIDEGEVGPPRRIPASAADPIWYGYPTTH